MKMFRIGEEDVDDPSIGRHVNGVNNDNEIALFGGFDDDDPDFVDIGAIHAIPRPRSRVSSRNSSSSSLFKSMSNNGRVRFYLGSNIDRHPSNLSMSTRSSDDSLAFYDVDATPSNGQRDYFMDNQQPKMEQCSLCCVCWDEGQFSFVCNECGGYAMERDCPDCNGECNSIWKRDCKVSHALRRATWIGACNLAGSSANSGLSTDETKSTADKMAANQEEEDRLVHQLEKL